MCAFLLRNNEYSIGCAIGLCFEPVMIQIKVVHSARSFCPCPLGSYSGLSFQGRIIRPRDTVTLKSVNIFIVIVDYFSETQLSLQSMITCLASLCFFYCGYVDVDA